VARVKGNEAQDKTKRNKMTCKSKVEAALKNKNLRQYVHAIDSNGYATPGEVVLWINGMGHPVYSVQEATSLVQRVADAMEADAE